MSEKNYHHGDLKNALIRAGMEILALEGLSGLSLRKVALRAGVSHSAPYSHFPDKQSLIAAISTEGFHQLFAALDAAVMLHVGNPRAQLLEGMQAYTQFALKNTDIFKIMFSSVLEKEKDHPAFVDISQKSFARVVDVVRDCQEAGVLRPGATEALAVALWGQVHGIVSLALEGQISHTVLERWNLSEIVTLSVEQIITTNR